SDFITRFASRKQSLTIQCRKLSSILCRSNLFQINLCVKARNCSALFHQTTVRTGQINTNRNKPVHTPPFRAGLERKSPMGFSPHPPTHLHAVSPTPNQTPSFRAGYQDPHAWASAHTPFPPFPNFKAWPTLNPWEKNFLSSTVKV